MAVAAQSASVSNILPMPASQPESARSFYTPGKFDRPPVRDEEETPADVGGPAAEDGVKPKKSKDKSAKSKKSKEKSKKKKLVVDFSDEPSASSISFDTSVQNTSVNPSAPAVLQQAPPSSDSEPEEAMPAVQPPAMAPTTGLAEHLAITQQLETPQQSSVSLSSDLPSHAHQEPTNAASLQPVHDSTSTEQVPLTHRDSALPEQLRQAASSPLTKPKLHDIVPQKPGLQPAHREAAAEDALRLKQQELERREAEFIRFKREQEEEIMRTQRELLLKRQQENQESERREAEEVARKTAAQASQLPVKQVPVTVPATSRQATSMSAVQHASASKEAVTAPSAGLKLT